MDSVRERHSLSTAAPSKRPVLPPIDPIIQEWYCDHLPRPNTWPLNIQPLGQFRPHCGFLLARFTLPSSVAHLLHTAG